MSSGCGVGDIIARSESESVQCRSRSAFGQSAEHDHGEEGIRFSQRRQRFQPVEFRHFDIERDEIGIELWELAKGNGPC